MEVELNGSSPISGGLSSPNHDKDPEAKEISDDDDDDRNHKHRRRETNSQSLGRDSLEQSLSQPYKKRNRPFENGQSDPFPNFDKRRPTGANFSRFSGEHGPGRGRGRDYMRDSRFGSIDATSRMTHPGCIPSAMFPGRNGFGLIPGIPNGTMDVINPLGFPSMLRPQFNHSLNMGIKRQRCRDFEERGFCMRGDMCPMEHGVNRIVVEDVQSLSQFNLPMSMPSAHLLGTGFVPSVNVSSSAPMNNRVLHDRTSKSNLDDDAVSLDGIFSGAISSSGADVYDPDQPLWNNNVQDMSTPLLGLQPSNIDGSTSILDADLSDGLVRSCGTAVGSQITSSSVWGRIRNTKKKLELKEKFESKINSAEYPKSKAKDNPEASTGTQGALHPPNQNNVGPKIVGSTSKVHNDISLNARKQNQNQNQKAQRTLFVNCIPLKDNKKETLLNHFRKFGEVIDIYIPANSERAFVQFSKREEAEKALKAPDAVMGSRFIKLWWANRDSVADEGMSSGNNVYFTAPVGAGSSHPALISKGNQYAASKGVVSKPGSGLVIVGNDSKLIGVNSPKAQPVQKKMENLELLREELRKKQEMLEQKRTEFRNQLDKLAKQAVGVKSEVQATKRQKVEISSDTVQAGKSSDGIVSGSSGQAEILASKVSNVESNPSPKSKSNSGIALQDPLSLKHTVRSMTTHGAPFHMNRYKLDNRPTAFRIHGPLPAALANVAALKDHFSSYGEISNVEIEQLSEDGCPKPSNNSEAVRNCYARISFATRAAAERAFLNAKSWQGHNFKFVWLTSNIIPSTSRSSGESSSSLKAALNAEVQSIEKTTHENSCDSLPPPKVSPSPPKSRGSFPVGIEDDLVFEAHSPENAANFIPLEAVEPENMDFEEEEEEAGGDDGMQLRKDSKVSPQH